MPYDRGAVYPNAVNATVSGMRELQFQKVRILSSHFQSAVHGPDCGSKIRHASPLLILLEKVSRSIAGIVSLSILVRRAILFGVPVRVIAFSLIIGRKLRVYYSVVHSVQRYKVARALPWK